jgi:hypothetical protein
MEKTHSFHFYFICDFNFPFHSIIFACRKLPFYAWKNFHCLLEKIPSHVAKASYLYAVFFSLSGGCGLWLFNGSPGRGVQRYDARTSTQTSGQTF